MTEAKKLRTTGERRGASRITGVAGCTVAGIVVTVALAPSQSWLDSLPLFPALQRLSAHARDAGRHHQAPLALREIFLWQRPPSKCPPPGNWSPAPAAPSAAMAVSWGGRPHQCNVHRGCFRITASLLSG
jgi:hypothetical protein